MSKEAFGRIKAGLEDALAYAEGDAARGRTVVPRTAAVIDVKAARQKLGLSQGQFAAAFGVSLRTIQKWEQGERRPTGAARVLLAVIDRHPEAVLDAVS